MDMTFVITGLGTSEVPSAYGDAIPEKTRAAPFPETAGSDKLRVAIYT